MTDVGAAWRAITARVTTAAQRVGRTPESVRIIAAAKTQPIERLEAALAAGAADLGENYVQEAAGKVSRITSPATWHLIGHLQRNKAARAAELFHLIHTLDSAPLGIALARQAERLGHPVRVLIEVNIGAESTKHGVPPTQAAALLAALAPHEGLVIDGLMTIPPPVSSPEDVRPHFRALRELRDRLRAAAPANAPLRELSMGMTDDFEVAIEEGATMVRIGRAIFGERHG